MDKERRISPGGSRTTHLAARTKNDVSPERENNAVSHRAVQEQRISPGGRKTTDLARIFFLKFYSGSSARLRSARVYTLLKKCNRPQKSAIPPIAFQNPKCSPFSVYSENAFPMSYLTVPELFEYPVYNR